MKSLGCNLKDKKILIIHHGSTLGGGLIALLSLIKELKNSNNRVVVLVLFPGIVESYIEKENVEVITPKSLFYRKFYRLFIESEADYCNVVDVFKKIKYFFIFLLSKYLFASKELKSLSLQFDILYLNSTFISDFSYYWNTKVAKKVVIHIREPIKKGSFYAKYIKKNIKKYCSVIICISKDNRDRLGIHENTVVEYDKIYTRIISKKGNYNFEPNLKYFLYVGGEQRIKGFEQLVGSLKYLDENIRIIFLGGELNYSKTVSIPKKILRYIFTPYYFKNIKLREKLCASEKVIYIGLSDDVYYYLENSIGLICPFSKPHAALPILESYSIGKPVIASNVTGMEEFVNDKKTGFLFSNGDSMDLAKKVNVLSNLDYLEINKMKKSIKEFYNSLYEK